MVSSICLKSVSCSLNQTQQPNGFSSLRSVSLPISGKSFPSLRSSKRAKPQTFEKVWEIVKKQSLPEDSEVKGDSKLWNLVYDTLGMVDVMCGLEQEFGIDLVDESPESIVIVQDVADLIEKLVEKK